MAEHVCWASVKETKRGMDCQGPWLLRTVCFPTGVLILRMSLGQPARQGAFEKSPKENSTKEAFCLGTSRGACFITNPSISMIPQVIGMF